MHLFRGTRLTNTLPEVLGMSSSTGRCSV